MYQKFLCHGRGCPLKAEKYILAPYDARGRKRATVVELRGDLARAARLAASLRTVHRYTSIVVAWTVEDAPTKLQLERFIDEYERAAFAGLERDQYAWSVVMHVDQDESVHLHIFVTRVELRSGKAMNIAPPQGKSAFYWLCKAWNAMMGWARADDPSRARLFNPGFRAPALKGASVASIDHAGRNLLTESITVNFLAALQFEPDKGREIAGWVERRVRTGLVNSRDDVVASLAELGMVQRVTGKGITIQLDGENEKIVLRGLLFDNRFDADAIRAGRFDRDGQPRARNKPDLDEAETALTQLEAATRRHARYNHERYGAARGMDLTSSCPVRDGNPSLIVWAQQSLKATNERLDAADVSGRGKETVGGERASTGSSTTAIDVARGKAPAFRGAGAALSEARDRLVRASERLATAIADAGRKLGETLRAFERKCEQLDQSIAAAISRSGFLWPKPAPRPKLQNVEMTERLRQAEVDTANDLKRRTAALGADMPPYRGDELRRVYGFNDAVIEAWNVREDEQGNALIPLFKNNVACGWGVLQLDGVGLQNSCEGLAMVIPNRDHQTAAQFVVARNMIDAMSWAMLHDNPLGKIYVCIPEVPTEQQISELRALLSHTLAYAPIVASNDDVSGDRLTEVVRNCLRPPAVVIKEIPDSKQSWGEQVAAFQNRSSLLRRRI